MSDDERLTRWRLVLGGGANDGTGVSLSGDDAGMDGALGALYDAGREPGKDDNKQDRRGAGHGLSAPSVPRWLGDIRKYFPTPVVQVLQKDALERLDLKQMMLEPELIDSLEPDVDLVSTLVSMRGLLTGKTKETARIVVRRVVDDLVRRLSAPMRQAVNGAVDRSSTTRRPRPSEIDWPRTIRANMRHWQPEFRTVVPQTLLGHGRRRRELKKLILLVDQSGSMANSAVYAAVLAAVMLSLPVVKTHLLVFDTQVVDLTDTLADPVDTLFSINLGGGTDINLAMSMGEKLVENPEDTIVVLLSDLIEGGVAGGLLQRAARMKAAGVNLISLLALSDEGAPAYDHEIAGQLAALGVPCFACTPQHFPGLMAAALSKQDVGAWASGAGLKAG